MRSPILAVTALALLATVVSPAAARDHKPEKDSHQSSHGRTVEAAEPTAILIVGAGLAGALLIRRRFRR